MPEMHIGRKALPALDLLSSPPSNAYFDAREHKAFYEALKTVEARRDFHAKLIEAAAAFLELTSNGDAQALVDELIKRDLQDGIIRGQFEQVTADVQRRYPRGFQLLDVAPPLILEDLKRCYRTAALKHHPDRGGMHEDMISINEAYTELHGLVIGHQFAPEADSDYNLASQRQAARVLECLDYRYVIVRLLLTVHLDEWALDHAFDCLQVLCSDPSATTPYTKDRWRLIELTQDAAKLATRLSLAGLHREAEVAMRVATLGVEAAQHEGLLFDGFLRQADLTISGAKRSNVVLNHPRQADNAMRLGVIAHKRHQQLAAKFSKERGARNAREATQLALLAAYAKAPGFLPSLPPDGPAKGKMLSQRLVPEPGYYVTRVSDLTDDQQAEYAVAFTRDAVLIWARKYMFVRLQTLLETAILHDSGPGLAALEREARLVSQLRGDSPEYYALAVADAINFLSGLSPQERSDRLRCLRALHGTAHAVSVQVTGLSVSTPNESGACAVRLSPQYFDLLRRPLAELRDYGLRG
jgi:hypothetical protein